MEYLKRRCKMPKKKSKRKVYFGQEVQDAIIEYNSSLDNSERNIIYGTRIHAAFDKLAENIINTFKFTYFDYGFNDIKHEVVAFMVMNIHKYDHTKGSKAFSYFSIVAKNYLILHNNNNYKKMKQTDALEVTDFKRDPMSEVGRTDMISAKREYVDLFVEYWDNNLATVFKRKQDIDVANSVLYLMEHRENIENFNKKALYIMIREMTNSNTQHITRVINVMKKHHVNLQKNYLTTGSIETKWTGSWENL